MTKNQILQILSQRYPSESPKVLNEVAYNMTLANVDESTIDRRAAHALERLKSSQMVQVQSPLAHEAARNKKQALSVCQICKQPMKTVKLLEDRNAYYCNDHRIVVPFPIVEEDEADV